MPLNEDDNKMIDESTEQQEQQGSSSYDGLVEHPFASSKQDLNSGNNEIDKTDELETSTPTPAVSAEEDNSTPSSSGVENTVTVSSDSNADIVGTNDDEDKALAITSESAQCIKPVTTALTKKSPSIIDVTKINFEEKLAEIKELLPKTSFISFDLEMTGLELDEEHKIMPIDTIEDRYLKLRDSASQFEVVQFGLCLWFVEKPEDEFSNIQDETERLRQMLKSSLAKKTSPTAASPKVTARPYNFYLFKAPSRSSSVFSCQNTCLQFLVQNKMDLNKVIAHGITYMNEIEETTTRENITRIVKSKATGSGTRRRPNDRGEKIDSSRLTPEQREFLENCKERVADWVANSTDAELDLDPCNGFERKFLFEELGSLYEGKLVLNTINTGNKRLSFIRVTRVGSETTEERINREIEEAVSQELGFSRVIRELTKHKHLILIGHNAMLDMMHVVHKFIKPLPASSEEFKAIVRENFENVIDTKYICETYPQISSALVRDTSLRTVFDYTLHRTDAGGPRFENFDEFYEGIKDFDHVAAFDAFMTGFVFMKISQIIGTNRNKIFHGVADLSHIKEMVNIINVMNCDHNFKLLKPNPLEDRSDVFLLTGLSQEVTNEHIKEAFYKYGMIKIFWINARYCWVKLTNKASGDYCNRDVMDVMNCHNQGLKTLVFEKGVSVMSYYQAKEGHILPTLSQLSEKEQETLKKRKSITSSDGGDDENYPTTPNAANLSMQTTSPAGTSAAFSPMQTPPSQNKRARRSTSLPTNGTSSGGFSCQIL
ncbi:hypothetical protein C9374_014675 [Naegleria lovaniensis]|uniref:Uncharacterized protein n=1 Tax=Naegleria lovaniensis TaxID=51637 RepID=A0AA88GB73_NAELO|nr:uncharacterized protein C9374_014675 [Naegleria lovaniensis]KAG2370681.1 hypothetical protein C9374_014675 [Naegleria lovaniensis]